VQKTLELIFFERFLLAETPKTPPPKNKANFFCEKIRRLQNVHRRIKLAVCE
jgi:hypothetical protein